MNRKITAKEIIKMSDGSKRIQEKNLDFLILKYSINNKVLLKWYNSIVYPMSKRREFLFLYLSRRFHRVPMVHNILDIMNKEKNKIDDFIKDMEAEYESKSDNKI